MVTAMLLIESYSCRIVRNDRLLKYMFMYHIVQGCNLLKRLDFTIVSKLQLPCSCLCNIFHIFFLPLNFLQAFYTQHSLNKKHPN